MHRYLSNYRGFKMVEVMRVLDLLRLREIIRVIPVARERF